MRALIVDDEPMPAKDLAYMIDKHCFEITSTEICLSASKAIDLVKEQPFDILFLDIEMPEMTGFDFIQHAQLPKETQVIITTAYEQYALEAFNADAVHYLVKPVTEQGLVKAVRKAIQRRDAPTITETGEALSVISVFDGNMHHIVKHEEVVRLEADGNYTTFHLRSGKQLVSSKNLSFYEDLLSGPLFFRPHRSHIINLREVSKLSKGKTPLIVLSNGDHVPLTKPKHESFEKALGLN